MEQKQDVKILNNMLKGIYMGIDAYEKCLDQVKNQEVKNQIQNQLKEQENLANDLSNQIKNIGGVPKNKSGITSIVPDMMTDIKLLGFKKDIEVLNLLSQGVKMGIDSYEKNMNDLSDQSKDIAKAQLQKNREIYSQIETLKQQSVQ